MKIYLPISFGIDALLLFLLKDFISLSVFSIAPLFILALSVFIAVLYKRTKNESLDFHVNSFGMTQKEKEECNIFVSNFLLLTLPFHVLLIFLGNAFLKIFLSIVLKTMIVKITKTISNTNQTKASFGASNLKNITGQKILTMS